MLDQDERSEIYEEAQRVIAEDAAYVFLHINNQYEAHRAAVQGYEHYPTGSMISLKETWIE